MRRSRRSRNWTSFSSLWARAWDGDEVVDLAVGRLVLHYAEENPDEVVAVLDDKKVALSRGLLERTIEEEQEKRRRACLPDQTYHGVLAVKDECEDALVACGGLQILRLLRAP
jgi:hypothetical protein